MMKKNIILGIVMGVILFSCSKEEKVEPVVEELKNQIVTYTDLEFALEGNEADFGSFFSFETEKMYKVGEINDENGAKIDIAFGSFGNSVYYFESPKENDNDIPNAKVSEFINWESTLKISVADFDAMADDTLLDSLTVNDTNESFGVNQVPGTIPFKIADGRKGVIRTKIVNANRLLVDIKIQMD